MEKTQATATKGRAIYTAKTHTTGGREHGVSNSDDGHLSITLSTPGTGGTGTNPEQLFAAGWSACFEGAMQILANKKKVKLPEDTAIDAEVDLMVAGVDFSLRARLNISIPGMDRAIAQAIVDEAQTVCPYSKAIHGNVDVEYNLI